MDGRRTTVGRRSMRLALVGLLLAGCGGASTERSGREGAVTPDRLYPMEEGHVWAWQVEDGEGLRALAQSRVVVRDGTRAVVEQNGGQRIVYQVRPEGIFRQDLGVWLLKAPLRAGASWPGASGRTARITATDAAVEVPAGRFEGCLRVEEEGGQDGRRIVTVYCPDVGPVLVETSIGLPAAGRQVRVTARLLGHAVDAGEAP